MHRQTPVWQVRNTAPFRRLRASPARTRQPVAEPQQAAAPLQVRVMMVVIKVNQRLTGG
ncbi:hypothetical protein [Yersinia enterocolitica]|uniref:hypothetical protein n=1 Tax=Yersinia enterocolitica TaxID=630 RepID=UPI003F48AD00